MCDLYSSLYQLLSISKLAIFLFITVSPIKDCHIIFYWMFMFIRMKWTFINKKMKDERVTTHQTNQIFFKSLNKQNYWLYILITTRGSKYIDRLIKAEKSISFEYHLMSTIGDQTLERPFECNVRQEDFSYILTYATMRFQPYLNPSEARRENTRSHSICTKIIR